MTTLYQNKYRIPSVRLQKWDYRWSGAYFITICTRNRKHYFGEIKNGKMYPSPIGAIADVLWHELKNHFKNIDLDAFVVMPNHIHGILILNGIGTDGMKNVGVDGNAVETGHALSLQSQPQTPPQQQPPQTQPQQQPQTQPQQQPQTQPQQPPPQTQPPQTQPQQQPQTEKTVGQKRFQNIGNNSVSSIIGSYKSAVTKHVRRLGFDFAWQPLFYDHIIRDMESYERIQSYIVRNPQIWGKDKFCNLPEKKI
ncbi:MAG: transposase [Bacteroidota bacterium]